jgi:hypothetical protein
MSDTKSAINQKRGRDPPAVAAASQSKNNLACACARGRHQEKITSHNIISQWKGQRSFAFYNNARVTHLRRQKLKRVYLSQSVCVWIRTCTAGGAKTPHGARTTRAERVSSRTKRGACGANDCLHPTNSTLPTA